MKNLTLILISLLGFLLVGAFVGWRVHVAAHTLTPVEGLVFDPSTSHIGSKDRACEELTGLAATLLAQAPDPSTKLTIMEIGNARTGGEPILLTTTDAVPARHNLASGLGKLKKDRASYLDSVRQACVDAPAPEYSAIYSAIRRMLEHVSTFKCGTAAACTVWVSTDGIENVELLLQNQIMGASSKGKHPTKLTNDNVDVRFCGLAESSVTATRNQDHRRAFHLKPDPARLESAWRTTFTAPERITFAPFCPQPPPEFQTVLRASANEYLPNP